MNEAIKAALAEYTMHASGFETVCQAIYTLDGLNVIPVTKTLKETLQGALNTIKRQEKELQELKKIKKIIQIAESECLK